MSAGPSVNRRIVLARRPQGAPSAQDFRLEAQPVPVPGAGQVLLRTRYLSLDPYMRGRMNEARSYVAPVAIGAPMVGQIARIEGCRAIGVAGGREKCGYALKTLGFDECLDHREAELAQRLAAACPNGIDVYFESVGGAVLGAVLPLLNIGARVPVCGLIAWYNLDKLPEGVDRTPQLLSTVLRQRIKVQGFIIFDHYHRVPAFQQDMSGWLREGRVSYREQVIDGLENAPRGLMGMLRGENFGK